MKEFGFISVEDVNFLENENDPLFIPMGDPSIRSKTSHFVLKYVK